MQPSGNNEIKQNQVVLRRHRISSIAIPLLAAVVLTGIGYAQGDSKAQEAPAVPSGEERFVGMRELYEKQYDVWMKSEKAAYDQLRRITDPCNLRFIRAVIDPVAKHAQSYYDQRLQYIKAYSEDRIKAAETTKNLMAGSKPTLDLYESERVNEEKMIGDTQERLKALGDQDDKLKKDLEDTLAIQRENLVKIKSNIEKAQASQKSGDTARIRYEEQVALLQSHLTNVTEDAHTTQEKYKALIDRYNAACADIPIRDFRQDDPAAKNPPQTKNVKKKQ